VLGPVLSVPIPIPVHALVRSGIRLSLSLRS
jgi:hypothetical protein